MPQSDYYLDKEKRKNGVRMPLFKPDGGISEDYIMVRWAWSDEVRAVMDQLKKDMRVKFADDGDPDADALILDGIVSQVASWGGPSFDKKATKSNVRAFLKERPDIADRIDTLSANTKLFFTDSGKSSSPGLKQK
jgi:hypothetical protein